MFSIGLTNSSYTGTVAQAGKGSVPAGHDSGSQIEDARDTVPGSPENVPDHEWRPLHHIRNTLAEYSKIWHPRYMVGQVARILPLAERVALKSHFLFGPRQTGKSTLTRAQFPDAVYYDMLDSRTYGELAARPWLIRERLTGNERIVIIDEIQKLPALLDEVHLMIERNPALRFVLTGSSARKLTRGGANLLAGRAWVARLHPLISAELDFAFTEERLLLGSLPVVMHSPEPFEELRAYSGTYLREEIRAEGLVRSVEHFARFLEVAALTNGEQVNFTGVASDAQVPARTAREFYQILVDTLLGFFVEPYRGGKRKAVAAPKFYLFDTGVANSLLRRTGLPPGTPEYRRAFEHLVAIELRAWLDYQRLDAPLTFWRTKEKDEVDFVVGNGLAIEAKAAEVVTDRHLKSLRRLHEERPMRRLVVVSRERQPRRSGDGVEILPLSEFLRLLWSGAFNADAA